MADPYDLTAMMAGNPYMGPAPDWRQVLSNALIGVGAGISGADASGRGWGAGIAPGLMMGANLTGQQQQQAQQNQLRQMMFGLQLAEFNEKRAERARQEAAIKSAADEYAQPGIRAPTPSAVNMGPGSYDTKLAGYEGGGKNGGMVFNELGSGAFGPFQFMPATYAGVRAKRPDLNLPEDMTKATREQWNQAHDVLKADNAQGLQAAGFQPTPENLYLAHRFGVGGATSVLRADPDKLLAEVLPIDWQRQNPDMRGQTAGGFRRLAAERMGGIGVPYDMPQTTTRYALQPNALPAFDDSTLSLLPRGNSRFMPGVLPQVDAAPGFTAPVMPQPQGVSPTPAQFTPTPAGVPGPAGPPTLADVPKPALPPEDAARIRRALMNRSMTPEQARDHANKIVDDLWNQQREQARARFQQENENYRLSRSQDAEQRRFDRGQEAKDAWETLDPKNAQMMLGPGYDNGKSYQRNKVTGEIKPVGGAQTVVNIDNKTEAEFGKEMGKMDAQRFGKIIEAEGTMNDMASKIGFAMDQFRKTYTGPGAEAANQLNRILGAAGFEEAGKKASAADAAQAVISQMKPHMRASGSGASSDKDMDMFAKALPSLMNLPDGNERIAMFFQKMADRATRIRELAQEYSEGGRVPLTRTQFDAEVKKLGPLFNEEEKKILEGASKAPQMPPPPAGFTIVTPGAAPKIPPPPAGFTVRP